MKKATLSTREIVMIVFLVILLSAVLYYMLFLTPLKEELASVESDISNVETLKESNISKLSQMNKMESELKELKEQNDIDDLSQVPVYDNSVEVVSALNLYLKVNSLSYNLDLETPEIAEDGTVRRVIDMTFQCQSYDDARDVINELTNSKWRCLVGSTIITADDDGIDVTNSVVTVQVTITFFEISDSEPIEAE